MFIEGKSAESYRVIPGHADSGIVLLCDHASNALPAEYGTLGLEPGEFGRHIAYDIGAAAITEHLAAALGAPAVLSCHSRLLIDPNRGEDDPTLIMRLSDGAVIPGNHHLSAAERERRIARYYRPYHDAIGRVVAAARASGRPPIIFSVHSMTHAWKGIARPWQVSILWNEDRRLARPLLEAFRADPLLTIGDNEPYHGGLEGDTLWQHARPHDLPSVVIEYRQDLVADDAGQTYWAEVTAGILRPILKSRAAASSLRPPVTEPDMPKTQPAPTPPDHTSESELEAAAFRRLVAHLRERTDVQNIDLMNLAGFCRNCLANWYQDAAVAAGLDIGKDVARQKIYGMPYEQWRAKYQKEASAQQKAAFASSKPQGH